MGYEVSKQRVYKDGELYNAGEGLSVLVDTPEAAYRHFANMVFSLALETDRVYSVHAVDLSTGTVVHQHGPSKEEATTSMLRAYRLRYAKEWSVAIDAIDAAGSTVRQSLTVRAQSDSEARRVAISAARLAGLKVVSVVYAHCIHTPTGASKTLLALAERCTS